MKAWVVSEKNGDVPKEVVFADTVLDARLNNGLYKKVKYINIRVKRLPIADGLNKDRSKLDKVLKENGLM